MKPFMSVKLACTTPHGRFSVQQEPYTSMKYLRNAEFYIDSLRNSVIAEYGDHAYRRATNDSGWLLDESLMEAMEKLDYYSEERDEFQELVIEAYNRQESTKYRLPEESWDDIDPLDITPLTTKKGMEDFINRFSVLAEQRQEMEVEEDTESCVDVDEELNYGKVDIMEPETAQPSNGYISEVNSAEDCVLKIESFDFTQDFKLPELVLESPLDSVSPTCMAEDYLSPCMFDHSIWTPVFKDATVEIQETWSVYQPSTRTSFDEPVPELAYDCDIQSSTDRRSRSPSIAHTPSWSSFTKSANSSKIDIVTSPSSDDEIHSPSHSIKGLAPENVFATNSKSPGTHRRKSRRMSEFLLKANTSVTKSLKWSKNRTKSESVRTTIDE
ncbi:hypothetical protein BZA77DRAFT_360391 [Pyronema omphalodes]|nr:hypothetical protein BZA77DRAFT_360391 [Pyronema omphalodes]